MLLKSSLKRVQAELVADPHANESRHKIEVSGAAGPFTISSESALSPVNPKTSALTAFAVAYTLREAVKLN
ncbi:aspartate dehydrogenase domain-containing protein [Corynebacterium sp.]|uniref:aspartate dehydrogenase domain-containing protein n=1 Tax=Corynebacterium sp. TaxID=1720 RepID=UPI0028ACED6C|nr:aspartate dehydrogenase domain-containing protein [Corynebacterium sp.]